MDKITTKFSIVTIVGRPSSGKSTLINNICNQKISIVSPVPQTTRNTIKGIYQDQRGQLVLTDTPGFHISEKKFNKKLKDLAITKLKESDLILYMVDSIRNLGEEEQEIIKLLQDCYIQKNIIILFNKMDIIKDQDAFNKKKQEILKNFDEDITSINISALKDHDNMYKLIDILFAKSNFDHLFYDNDTVTDQSLNFRISELIREKAIFELKKELPHDIYVSIYDIEERKKSKIKYFLRVFICVASESQKRIIIGHNGSKIKKIRERSQEALLSLIGETYLDLRVKVDAKWKNKDKLINRIVY